MVLVQVIDIATGQVVAEYPIPPTEIITLEPGQEVVFGDVDYGDPNNPNVIIEVINDEHIQVTIDAGSLLIENLYKFLEEGEDAGLVFADSGQPFGTGPQALLVPSFDSLDAFTATAAGGPGADGGGTQTGTSGRGNDGGINPPDLNVDHLHAPTIEGVIPRPDFDFESDIVPEDPDEVVSSPVIVSISDAAPVQEPVLSDEEEEEGEGEGGAHCDDEGEGEGQGGGGGTAGGIFVTGHDSDEHENVDYLNAGLDFLFFGEASDAAARTGHTVALLDNSLGTGGTGGNGGDDVVPLLNGAGWSATYFDTDFDISDAFNFDAIVVASGTFGNTAFHDALIANSQAFTDFINNGGKLYINTDQGFGQDWYEFVPTFGASQAALGGQAVYTATAEGNLIGLTETIVDFDITHTEYQNVDTSIFTIFETHNTSGDVVAFGSNNLTIGDGGFQTGCDDFIMAEFTVFLETGVT
ncbi:MAG: hypothetical protein VCC99_04045, partial [Alphaproteobacteria bacterium]